MKSRELKISIIICMLLIVLIPLRNLKADSGFDFSYDSGGSSFGGSDWGGSSSDWGGSSWSDHDYSSHDHSGSSGSSSGGVVVYGEDATRLFTWAILLPPAVFIFFLLLMKLIDGAGYREVKPVSFVDLEEDTTLTDEEIKRIDPNLSLDIILNKTYETYVKLQKAWMNFDTVNMRKLVSDELYRMYKMQLGTLKDKGQQNIMEDFKYLNGYVVSLTKVNDIETACVCITVSQKDYIVDENKNLLRGDLTDHTVSYYLTIDKAVDDNSRITNCPNCGAPLSDEASQTCGYCNSNLSVASKDFIISKKEIKLKNKYISFNNYSIEPKYDIKEFDKNKSNEDLIKFSKDIFIKLHQGLNKGNLSNIKEYVSEDVFDKFTNKLVKDKNNQEKYIIDDISIKSTEIGKIEKSNGIITVTIKLKSKYKDYVVNKNTDEFIRGNDVSPVEHFNILVLKKKNGEYILSSIEKWY